MSLNKIANHIQLQHNLTFATEVCYSCTRHFLLGTFYLYRTARTCSEPRSVERRLSFAVEVTTASGNWKHPLPLKTTFSARFQWLLCFRNGRHLTPPTLVTPDRATKVCLTYLYMYIRIAFSIELRLRVSRLLANYQHVLPATFSTRPLVTRGVWHMPRLLSTGHGQHPQMVAITGPALDYIRNIYIHFLYFHRKS